MERARGSEAQEVAAQILRDLRRGALAHVMHRVGPMTTHARTVGEIAALEPAATRVFLRHKIDFCCGGKRSLDDACERAGVERAAIERELEAEAARCGRTPHWETRPMAELVDHIVRHYHEALRRDVPALIDAARKVERVHADKPAVPLGLADVLVVFWSEMQSHMRKEEEVLFPVLRRGLMGPMVAGPIQVMEAEHDEHAVNLRKIRELTGDLDPPPHACATWRALYDGLRTMEAELMQHIHLENNVLFARARLARGRR